MFCTIINCGRPVRARGFCNLHWKRWRRHGDPTAGRLPNGEALRFIQDVVKYPDDECLTWPFVRGDDGYGRVWHDGRLRRVSRLICELVYGPPPTPKHEAAHSCGKGHEGCVNHRHLRWATHVENEADKIIHGTSRRRAA